MTAKSYSLLAAVIFTIVAVLQLSRAVMGVQLIVGSHTMPMWPSWIAFFVASTLAWLGFSAARD
jgi:hypothetical protein